MNEKTWFPGIKKFFLFCTILTVIFLITLTSSPAYSDVVWLQNGKIYLGEINTAESDGITIKTFGETRKISMEDIFKTEKSLDSLKYQQIDITLKDGSVIKGKIQNYDEEIGINVNIDFGNITLPVQTVDSITDQSRKKHYGGSDINVGITGGYYCLLGEASDSFNNFFKLNLFAEFNTGLTRGLFAGIDIAFTFMDYSGKDNLSFSMYSFQPYAIYRFFNFRNSSSFMNRVVPFVAAGMGIAYLIKENSSDSGLNEMSELNFTYSLRPGTDIEIIENLWLRIYTGFESVPQKSNSLHQIVFNTGVMYSF